MNDMIETKERTEENIKLFLKNKTYTFVQTKDSLFFNGYIKSNTPKHIIFVDDKIGEIPIYKDNINKINYSLKKRENENV